MTPSQKVTAVVEQLNVALLRKDQLTEQLEDVTRQVRALRNLLTGIELGREAAEEQKTPAL
jgi:hypothetical protein